MRIIKDERELFQLFEELNSGGLEKYDDDDQALVLKLNSNGGPKEDYTLCLKFAFVEYFQLPIALDAPRIEEFGLDEIRLVDEIEARQVMPECCCETLDYNKSEYRCYRFYANQKPSPFYIYCLKVEGWLSGVNRGH